MLAQLVALSDGPNILLDKPILLLGRHPECDIQIDSRKISRRHCCIAQVSDYLVVRDLGSTNGVRINGVRVTEGRLNAGDELTIGNHRYQVRWDAIGTSRRGAGSAASRSTRRRTDVPRSPDDASLESHDEPVPLPEPGQSEAAPVLTAGPAPPAIEPAPPAPPEPSSPILPEKLNL